MTKHVLKIWPEYYDAVANGIKTFEIRKNDRDFKIGDTIRLREYNSAMETEIDAERYTGRDIKVCVVYMLTSMDYPSGIPEGYCILGIRVIGC